MEKKHLTIEDIARAIDNAPKQTPEQKAKSEEFARKMKKISSEELQELRRKAREKHDV